MIATSSTMSAGWILELDRGAGIPWKGNYSSWLEQKSKRLQVEEKQASARSRTLARELEWIKMSPRARQAKGKARINAYENLLAEGKQREASKVEIAIPFPSALATWWWLAKNSRSRLATNFFLMTSISICLRVASSASSAQMVRGKTTLFRMIAEEEKADSGDLRLGETVELSYVDQNRDVLDPEKTVFDIISGGEERIQVGGREVASRAYVSSFNFRGTDQQKLVRDMSGGERNRVHLATLIRRGGNLLLLDEPTNDLDVDTCAHLKTHWSTLRAAQW